VYLRGRNGSTDVPIEWLNREGTVSPLRATPADWSNLVFASDGRRLAMDISAGNRTDVWTYELERDSLDRLTLGPGVKSKPVWTPDFVTAKRFEATQTPNEDAAGSAPPASESIPDIVESEADRLE
jgi:hypothetical protein